MHNTSRLLFVVLLASFACGPSSKPRNTPTNPKPDMGKDDNPSAQTQPLRDTDGDGAPDLVESVAGTDPNDPTDNPRAHGDFLFVLQHFARLRGRVGVDEFEGAVLHVEVTEGERGRRMDVLVVIDNHHAPDAALGGGSWLSRVLV